ncbi:Uncharacterised protein [Mycobacteroides abscessus subsp. abscessus]|nr:Uncharacterised protein [Mycobacteroides abscessus subsp. abscessus]
MSGINIIGCGHIAAETNAITSPHADSQMAQMAQETSHAPNLPRFCFCDRGEQFDEIPVEIPKDQRVIAQWHGRRRRTR